MNKIIKIYCEGKKGSHDFDILEKVTTDLSVTLKIEPIGGKRGAASIIQFIEQTGVDKADFYLFFRDRDFDRPVPNSPSLTKIGNYIYCSYLTTIENYLYSTSLFFNFLKPELKTKYSINSETDVKNIFIAAAKSISNYQAIRHTLGSLRTNETNFNTTWTEGSGTLPDSLELDYCRQKAITSIVGAKGKTDNWTESGFQTELDKFLIQFNDIFFADLKFLVWFQGKDFATSITKLLPEFPLKDYYKYAKKNFDYNQFHDLRELRLTIQNMGNT